MAGLRCLCHMMGPLLRSPGLRGLSAGWANIPWGQEPEGHLPVGKLYGGRFTVTQIPGDGVGPELMGHVERVLSAARAPVEFEVVRVDSGSPERRGIQAAIQAVSRNGVALKGNFETAVGGTPRHRRSLNVLFRNELGLFASVNRYRSLDGVCSAAAVRAGRPRAPDMDVVVIRETTEGEYAHLEHESVPGVVESLKIITRRRSLRLAEFAFSYARRHRRRKLTAVHKANIMKLADGLFVECCRQVSEGYPEVEFDAVIVDNATMQLVSRPGQFDVLVMPNLYGVVINNICAGLVGGPGLVPGASYGRRCAVFQTAIRNTAPRLAGRDTANPVAMLLASCLMLDHLRLGDHAQLVRRAVLRTLTAERVRTPDIANGRASSTEVVDHVVRLIEEDVPSRSG
ncbi:isocitrate dehydrogenase [NAD] subunit gamma, mitochondrial-like [Rhincodon typus]|uniref:isocitrate dehydrogenase [NAD] subunit gamma, mitochondrial-like n=1 Tax=Rhincodon typus TaxID=259920 RepID=UPI0020308B1F|nr:isocitrate dehydrogenase [NAD] subunit gamma, mitochondrial-like [Rhincodon typus]